MPAHKYIVISMHVISPKLSVMFAGVPVTTIPIGSWERIMS